MQDNNQKNLWQRYKAEWQKQNSRPLPVWRFWLAIFLLLLILLTSLILILNEQGTGGWLALPLALVIAFMIYDKRPDRYRRGS